MDEKKKKQGRPIEGDEKKKLRTIKLEPSFEAALIDAAYWVPGYTVNKILEDGAKLVLKMLQEKHNGGEAFEPSPDRLEKERKKKEGGENGGRAAR